MIAIPLSLRFALRELRSGVAGFRIFLACLALGVAAIAAAGSTAEAFRQGLAAQSREILGGDLRITVDNRRFTWAERTVFGNTGRVAWAAASRAMAQSPSGERRLVDLRGVAGSYPLAGKVELIGAASLDQAFEPDLSIPGQPATGAAVEQALLDRLGLKLGQRFLIGNDTFIARAVLVSEPDRLGRGFALGPRVLTTLKALQDGGFLEAGVSSGETARIALKPGLTPPKAIAEIRKALPNSGLEIKDRGDAATGIRTLIDQLEYFLGFIGLASLVAGGLGVAGAVSAYLESRKPSIAVLKALGAEGALIRNLYLIQIALLAALGIAIGLGIGAVAPLILGEIAKNQLPVPALFAVYPEPLVRAGLFGLLAATAFSLAPLARARATPPAALFRRNLSGRLRLGPELVLAALAAIGLAALSVATAPTPMAAGVMIAGVAVAFGLLWLLGRAAAWGAGRLRGLTRGSLRIGLANLAGPRSAARTATPAIGLGVALLSAVVLIQSALLAQVAQVAPKTAPSLVFTEIPGARIAEFDAAVRQAFGVPLTNRNYLRAPFATGRIVRLKGRPVDKNAIKDSERWAFDNDITLSAIGPEPEQSNIRAGHWWPADYAGPPILAMEAKAADAAGLKVGDTLTVSVLGREIDAKIAVLRRVDVAGFGPGFPLIFDPAALAGAPLNYVAIAKSSRAQEAAVIRDLGRDFPAVNVISVREQLEAATALFGRLALAVRGAAAVAALASLLVLAGAIAAGARTRAREAATLKVLGAARGQILLAYGVEYGAVGLIAGVAGVALGYAAAWPVVVKVFEATWSVDWGGVAALIGGASGLAAVGGLLAAMQALSRRPAPVLRAE
jgi:putative ABC transport system permease protein